MKYLFVIMMLLPSVVLSFEGPDTHIFPAKLDRVVDADTMDVAIDLGLGLTRTVRIRISDYDAPETWRPESNEELEHGEQATKRTKELLSNEFWIRQHGYGVYNRVNADIILHDGKDYVEVMKSEDFSKRDEY